MEATIEVAGLRKRFGPALALDGMTFTVRPGQITGFVGPNGAGKSTTMRVILGLDAPDEGHALIGGKPYRKLRHPLSHVGALLDAAALQPSRSARNHLLWLAHSQGLTAKRADAVIEQAGLRAVARRRAGGYSLGMRQRLGIAAAMLGDPPVLMFDEPFNGMDPEGIVWMRGFLRSLAGEGRAVLVSSHLMGELEDTADHLVVAGRGTVIADTSVAALVSAASGDRVGLRTSARTEAMTVLAHAGATVTATGRDTLTVAGLTPEQIIELLGGSAVPFSEVSAHRATLEEAYMELTRDAAEFRAGGPGHRGPGCPRAAPCSPGPAGRAAPAGEEAAR
ncbi:MAG: ATP-binding cassette domain-containing protein [Nocardiopsaceae bacterium]|jgi:ABC-2 type transport system ATP-binding protein|nr:ATP-binding cassette domain-containing protein [Nocardiopsaceae bacterium]